MKRRRWTGWFRFPPIELPTPMGPVTTPAFSMQVTDWSARRGRMRRWRYQWRHARCVFVADFRCGPGRRVVRIAR